MKRLLIFFLVMLGLFSGCSLNKETTQIILQPNITIQLPQENKISDEIKISAIISSEFLERNNIQHYNTEKQTECTNKFKDDKYKYVIDYIGISNNPTLWDGNKLICDFSITEYKSGMFVAFNQDNERKIHRIKAVYDDYVITQGDNNVDDDGRIHYKQIECVVIGVCY